MWTCRRLLAGLVLCAPLIAVVVAVAAPPVEAACKTPTIQTSTKSALAVFTGKVTSAVRQDAAGDQGELFLHDVTVDRVYQGKVTTATVQVRTRSTPHECSLGKLATGTAYMFFVGGSGSPWVAADGGGTAPETATLVAHVVHLLGQGHAPVPPPPEKATFTPLATAAPTTLTRAAAPGLALMLVGVLGLLFVSLRARRRASTVGR